MKLRLLISLILLSCVSAVVAQDYKPYHGDGPDDLLRYVPLGATLTLKLCGVKSQNDWRGLAINGGLSVGISALTTWGLKGAVHETRPDGTDSHSFPSGHTSFAFAGARILDREYREVSPWISIAGYSVATYTAVDRVLRNRHHWYDVTAGAAIGIAATELGYWLGDKITHRQGSYAFAVTGNQVYFAVTF